jgi:hypothetical protein
MYRSIDSMPSRLRDRSMAVKIAGRKRKKWPAPGTPRSRLSISGRGEELGSRRTLGSDV